MVTKKVSSEEVTGRAGKLAAAGEALARVEVIDARLGAIAKERRSTEGTLPPGEVAERLVGYLRAQRNAFESGTGSGLSARAVVSALGAGKPVPVGLGPSPERELFALVTWLIPEDLLTGWARQAVERLALPETMGSADRAKLKARLDAERSDLVSERERLVDEVNASGVEFPHLDETRQRREREEADRRREGARAEAQARANGGSTRRPGPRARSSRGSRRHRGPRDRHPPPQVRAGSARPVRGETGTGAGPRTRGASAPSTTGADARGLQGPPPRELAPREQQNQRSRAARLMTCPGGGRRDSNRHGARRGIGGPDVPWELD